MGLERSVLTNRDITEILRKYFVNTKIIKIEKLERGTSNIYLIYLENKKVILKEFNCQKTLDSIKKEISIINFLKDKKLNVPTYIKTINGKYYCKKKNKYIILQEYIEGYTIDDNSGDYNKTMESARLLGKIVNALKKYDGLKDEKIIEKVYSKKALQNRVKFMQEQIINLDESNAFIKKDIQDKINIGKYLIENFDFNILNNVTILATHGDFNHQQLIYNGNKTTIIDFEKAKKMPIVWEIMRSYSYIDEKAKGGKIDINNLIDYFNEFCKYVRLNKYDLEYAAQIYLLQLVGSMFGYNEYIKDNSQIDLLKFGKFRTNLCRYLFENFDEIGKQLVKNVNIK